MYMPNSKEENRKISIAEALREALREEMIRDEKVFIMGEDVGTTPGGWGGPFTVCLGLVEEFGPERVRNTPISEKAIVGASVGAAIMGMRPVAEVQYADFLFCCMDEIVNMAAKMRYMSGGQFKVPMVLRCPTGATTRGAQHAQSPEGFFMHVPGIKVVAPSTPYDAKGLLKQAIRDDSPVLFFEHKLLYGSKGGTRKESGSVDTSMFVPKEEYTIPIGKADIKRSGSDVTVVSLLMSVQWSLTAAQILADKGIQVEVIDLRSLLPLDKETIVQSISKTGRLVVVEEDTKTLGWGAEVAAFVCEEASNLLKSPVRRVATRDVPIPFSPKLEKAVLPSVDKIVQEVQNFF